MQTKTTRRVLLVLAVLVGTWVASPTPAQQGNIAHGNADELLPVDCLLPAKVRKLGKKVTYLTARQAIKTTGVDCEIRGGEYVAYDRASYDTALAVWLPQAEGGDAKAQTYVGEIYERGLGTAPNYAEAAKWYQLAADQGYGPAQINLGQLHELGRGVPQDTGKAVALYRQASGLDSGFVAGASSAEVERLRNELSQRNQEVESLRRQLDDVQRELQKSRQQRSEVQGQADEEKAELTSLRQQVKSEREALEGERNTLAAEREALDKQRAAASASGSEASETLAELDRMGALIAERASDLQKRSEAVEAREAQMSGKEEAFAAKQAQIEQLDQEIARLKAEADKQRDEVAKASQQSVQVAALPGPTIQLIDPSLPLSRAALPLVRTARAAEERTIVGRVDAPAGLLTLTVNDEEVKTKDNGIFQTKVAVLPGGSTVSIIAIDNQGKRDDRAFKVAPEEAPVVVAEQPKAKRPRADIEWGQYYALVIGNNEYPNLPNLKTAVTDARAIGGLLENKYGFKVTRLENASRYQILSALNGLRDKLTEKDNLLIYYAGHGELDEVNMRGHWLPVDAESTSTANWISNVSLTDLLRAMSAKHVMVVADSCYSGALTRSALARLERGMTPEARISWQKKMATKRSRMALTSGGVAPVLDGGGGQHSIFAKAFLDVLNRNDEVLEGSRLFSEISALVTYAAEAQRFDQLPQYAPIKFGGHESGDFFFVPGV